MKRRTLVVAPEARDDLVRLYDRIADAASPKVAIGYLDRIQRHLDGFDVVSERGTRRDDIRPSLRIGGFERRITIAFTVDATCVTILRVFYSGQDWEGVLRSE